MLKENLSYTSSIIVTEQNTAIAMTSGDLPVLATPSLVALMENASRLCVKDLLPEGKTTVGGWIEVKHLKASPVGAVVKATATLTKTEGAKLYFEVKAYQDNLLVGEGKHLRFMVDRTQFLSKL